MIGIGFKRNGKITLEASCLDNEIDAATAIGESLARHGKGEVVVYLYHKGKLKVKILKRIRSIRRGFLWLGKGIAVK